MFRPIRLNSKLNSWALGKSSGGRRFNPNYVPITIGLQLWLDASKSNTITESGGSVSQWDDLSGNGNNVTQGTGSAQPTTNATTQNGKNVLDFDGLDFFTSTDSDLLALTNGSNTCFVVSVQDVTAQDYLINITESAVNRYALHYTSTAGDIYFQSRTAAANGVTFTGATTTNFSIKRGRREGTTQAIAVNGSAEVTNAFGADAPNSDAFWIGTRASIDSGLNGSIAEILMYNRSLTSAEITSVETYLSNKWLGFQIPSDIGNLQLWLDAADTSTITESSGLVSQWDDKSGQGNDAVQGTGANQPTTNANTQNGKNVIDFDGSTDFMSIADSASISLTGDCTFFFTGNLTDTTGTARNFIAKDANAAYRLRVTETGDLSWILLNDGVSSEADTSSSAVIFGASAILTTAVAIGGTISFRNNGTSIGTATTTKASIADTAGALLIGSIDGASENWLGNMSEILIYDRLLSASEIESVETYLLGKWGIVPPSSITGLQLWLDADDANTITESGGLVSQWDDKSGQSNDAIQGTGSAQPTTNATTINGKNVIDFGTQTDFMTVADDSTLDMDSGTGFTIFMVVNSAGFVSHGSGLNFFLAKGDGAAATAMYGLLTQSTNQLNFQSGSSDFTGSVGPVISGIDAIYTATMDNASTTSRHFVNGVLEATNNTVTVNSDNAVALTIGGATGVTTRYAAGSYAEILIYNRLLSTSERLQVESYLTAKWGI